MFINFFTVRIMLNALGVDDYGINNVVAGLVSMFSLMSGSLSSATSRFMTFGLGKGNMDELRKIFATTINIHILLAVVVVIAIETVGVWFLNSKMVIPADRLYAANWVLQCSVVKFAVGLLSVPYNSAIIAHEKMSAFAYMTIFDAAARLIVTFTIYYYGGDRLILLSVLNLAVGIISQSFYWIYCKRKFEECVYKLVWDKSLNKSIFSFAGWNFIGCTAGLMKDQGVNIVINLFHNPTVNAARGIAMQINGIVGQFVGGFTTALNPQIVKNYAVGDYRRMHRLIFQGTRLSYFLFMLLSIPIFFEIYSILYLWLGQVPEHTVLFARLVLVLTLAEIVSNSLIVAQNATGVIRNYQIVVGGILLLNLPVSYVCLKVGMIPECTVVVAIVISQICFVARLCFVRSQIKLPVRAFLKQVYFNVIGVTLLAVIPPAICHLLIENSYVRIIVVCLVSLLASVTVIYYVGCNEGDKAALRAYAAKLKGRFPRR